MLNCVFVVLVFVALDLNLQSLFGCPMKVWWFVVFYVDFDCKI